MGLCIMDNSHRKALKVKIKMFFSLLLLLIASNRRFGEALDSIEGINNNDSNEAVSNETIKAYELGIYMKIINPEKYPLVSFEQDERNMFKVLYKEYISINGKQPINYTEWLVLNNFGVMSDTQEPMFTRKEARRIDPDNKKEFMKTVKKGDILISGRGIFGLVGHAAMMTSDYWVLEMSGGASWIIGIESNNIQLGKDKWFDEYASYWTRVYRCPDADVAREAAAWADHNYYNPSGGSNKTIHITFLITQDIWKTNPSYCSKLVIQAYYYGGGSKKVVTNLSEINNIIVPTRIPTYFLGKYQLSIVGKY